MRRALAAIALVLAAGTMACSSVVPKDATPNDVRQAIGATWRAHLQAATTKDDAHIADLYAPDCVYVLPDGRELRGWPAIDAFEREGLTSTTVSNVRHTTHALQVAGDAAYELGTIQGLVQAGAQPAATVTYHFMALWTRQSDGGWRIRHLVGRPG